MTVQEAINKLNEIEDKTLPLFRYEVDGNHTYYTECDEVFKAIDWETMTDRIVIA